MATLASTFLTLADLYKRTEDSQQIGTIIEILNQANNVTQDIPWVPCNLGTIHRHTIRTGLPSVAWGKLYQGIAQSKSTTQQVDDTTGFVEGMATVDQRLLDISDDAAALRLSEALPHIEAMTQEAATALFYHSALVDPEKPHGLAARYATIGGSGAGNQIIDAGGTGADNTSIWFVTWGENDVCGLYPKGTQGGLIREDKGSQRVLDGSSNPYYVQEELFRWHMGFAVKDWRNTSRIANVDISNIAAGTVDLYGFMRNAFYKLQRRRIGKIDQQLAPGRTVIYCNRDVLEALDALASNQGSSDNFTRLRPMEIEGEEVMSYRGIPIRETDALVNTETQVT